MNSVIGTTPSSVSTAVSFATYTNSIGQNFVNTVSSGSQIVLFQSNTVFDNTPSAIYNAGTFTFTKACIVSFSYSLMITNCVVGATYFSYMLVAGEYIASTGPITKPTDASTLVCLAGTSTIKVASNSSISLNVSIAGTGSNGQASGNSLVNGCKISFLFY